MTRLLGSALACLGVTVLLAAGCSGESKEQSNAGGGGSASGAQTGGTGGSASGAHTGGTGGNAHPGGTGGSESGGMNDGDNGEGGAAECPMETFEVKWRNLHDTACNSEGLVCHKGSNACGAGTLVALSETLTCQDGKWYWPGYEERPCCPNLPTFSDSDGDACQDEGHVCYDFSKAYADCEPRDVLVCTTGTWRMDTRTPESCGGAGGEGGAGGNGGSGG